MKHLFSTLTSILISALTLTFCPSSLLFSQEKKFGLTIEYAPNYSKLTNEGLIDEKFKLSHNALVRISANTDGNLKPTIGLGFLNIGDVVTSPIGGQLGIESIKYIDNHNYIYIPVGAKINFGTLFLLPELGIGVNLSNRTTQITRYTNGETEKESRDQQLYGGKFNKISIPMFLSFGTDFMVGKQSFSTGLKAYYGLNQVVRNVPRKNHYFGFGLILAMNL